MENNWPGWLALAALLAAGVVLWPGAGLLTLTRRWKELRRRERFEDALKHVLAWDQRAQDATPESLAGALGMTQSRTLELITHMEERNLIQSAGGGLRLTAEGQRLALHVVRAHRLWERYLSDDAGVPMARLHQAAEKAEHQLTSERIDALDAHLGHPERDPHGDPIPRADGSIEKDNALPLTDWPLNRAARVTHIEDEPDVIFRQILAAGLRPGKNIRVLENLPERLVISDGEQEHRLAPVVAANIQVSAVPTVPERPASSKRLSELPEGEAAEIIELDALCRGFSRRRLLDLGLTPGTRIESALENPFGDPRAFRVRGTLIALRKDQGDQIWVRPVEKETALTSDSPPGFNGSAEDAHHGSAHQARGAGEA